jgi:hypothetical protein
MFMGFSIIGYILAQMFQKNPSTIGGAFLNRGASILGEGQGGGGGGSGKQTSLNIANNVTSGIVARSTAAARPKMASAERD